MTAAEQWGSDTASAAAADKALVAGLMGDLRAGFEKWEDMLEAHDNVTFEADFGDIYALVSQDGRLLHLSFAADVMSSYTFVELQARLNAVMEALAREVYEEYLNTFGGGVLE